MMDKILLLRLPQLALSVVVLHGILFAPTLSAETFDDLVKPFLGKYCTKCHGEEKQKAERRFDQLGYPIEREDTLYDFQDIVDQLNLGYMPPYGEEQPTTEESQAVVDFLTAKIQIEREALRSTGGETILRRMNQREYRNTIRDLLGLNITMFNPTVGFPSDEEFEHLDNVGDTLIMSDYLLERYLQAAEKIIDKALQGPKDQPPVKEYVFDRNFRQQGALDRAHRPVNNLRTMCIYENPRSIRFEGAFGPLMDFVQGVPHDGYYELKVLAESKNRRHPFKLYAVDIDQDEPALLGIVPGNPANGPMYETQTIQPLLAETTLPNEQKVWKTFRVWLDKGYSPRFTYLNGFTEGRSAINQMARQLRPNVKQMGIVQARALVAREGVAPQIQIHEVRIRGPLTEQWPPKSREILLGDKPFSPARTREILENFATRAYRRPATKEEVDRLMILVEFRQVAGLSPYDAMKDGLKAILCSPSFLYLDEPTLTQSGPNSPLTSRAIATRLSYFLCSTMPDERLRQLAEDNALLNPEVLQQETDRLLGDPKSEAFVNGFLDSWLNLRSLGDMPPELRSFREYYLDDLEVAMLKETRLFTKDLIDHNRDIINFLDSDYAIVNRGLAKLYEIPNIKGHEFRRVALTDQRRGGLLGQASVLTVTANGVDTSPVIRGVWLLENLLGSPPPPPPDNVDPIDPDVRGAKTIRDQLTKHRASPACYECHQKIDPPGFALENFDAIGGWRYTYNNRTKIDASATLPDGTAFENVVGFKKSLVQHPEQFKRALTEKLLSYACGRRIEPSDRPQVDAILEELEARGNGFRDLIELVVLSETFRTQ
ncbi:Secreted protein containing planctomycete cytochrome C domain [Planctomycetales bacterium 10988]|nr:Secreted protein containing planctomycete cytochrome C domain [Planctomycetales bacterium 10988]